MSEITTDQLTKNELEGTGVFDELMRAVKAHLNEELANGRITGVNYSSVYLGAIQSTMAQSVQFLLEKEKVGLQNDILVAQKANIEKEGDLLDLKKQIAEVELYNSKYQECTLKTKIAQMEAETQGILQTTANAKTQASLITKNIRKTQAEIHLYKQRTETEKAQIADKIGGYPIGGVIGIQKEMYRNQSNGYLRLAEQQYARMMLEAFAVLQGNVGMDNLPGEVSDWGLDSAAVADAIKTLRSGVTKQETEHVDRGAYTTGTLYTLEDPENTPVEPTAPLSCPVKFPI